MDSNNVKSKNKAKSIVALLILFLVICATGVSAMYVWKKYGKTEQDIPTTEVQNEQNMSGDMSVSDEEELRKALEADTECTITVTEEIIVDKGFTVNGNKTLVGTGKIVMALYSEAYQHLMHVQTGASLVLDGVTLDGNGIAGGVKVETGGELTYLSGDILYGFPYGIETDGKVTMKGGTIDESIHTGVYVTKGGETYMESGAILDSGAASVKVAVDAYMKISGDSRLQGSGSTILNISGKCDVTGGVMSDCNSYLAGVAGELNVEYQGKDKNGMLEWYNCGRSVILANADSIVNVKGLYIHDVKTYAVCNAEGNAKVNLENCLFENIERSAVVLKKGTITMKNIQMKGVKQHGVLIGKDTDVTIENLTVTNPGLRGIYNLGGTVNAKKVVITSPKEYGIGNSYAKDSETNKITKGNMDIENLTITGAQGACTINVDGSILNLKNAKIADSKSHGIRLKNESNATLTNVDIDKSGAQGIRIESGSKANITNIKITNPNSYGVTALEGSNLVSTKMEITNPGNSGLYVRMSKADLKELTVTEPKARGIYSQGGVVTAKDVVITSPKEYGVGDSCHIDSTTQVVTKGNVTIDGLTLTGVQGECAINVDRALLTLKNAKITDSKSNGICLKMDSKATLTNVKVDKVGAQALRIDTGSKVESTDVKLSNIGTYGVTVLEGSDLKSTNMEIVAPGNSGVYVRMSKADLKGLTVTEPKARGIYSQGGVVIAKDVVITSPKEYGIGDSCYIDSETQEVTKGNVTVDGLTLKGVQGECAINVDESLLTLKNATITDSDNNGICLKKGSEATLTKVKLDKVGAQGLRIDTGSKVKSTDVKLSNIGTYGVTVLEDSVLESANMEISSPGDSGVYVRMSTADMKDLTITEPRARGIYSHGGVVTAKDVVITSPMEYGIGDSCYIDEETQMVTKGNVTVDGLTLTGVQGECAINVDDSLLTLKNATITDSEHNGICLKKGSLATLEKVNLDKVGAQGLRIDTGSKVKSSDVTLSNITSYGVTVLEGSELDSTKMEITTSGNSGVYVRLSNAKLNGLNITETGAHGIYNHGGIVEAKDVEITSPKEYGIENICYEFSETEKTKGDMLVEGLTISEVQGGNGIHLDTSLLTLTNATVSNKNGNGICIQKNSEATFTNVSVIEAKGQGLRIDNGAKVTGTEVKVVNTTSYGITVLANATLNCSKLEIGNSGNFGLYVRDSKADIKDLTITKTKGEFAVNVEKSEFKLDGANISELEDRSVRVTNNGEATLLNVKIYDSALNQNKSLKERILSLFSTPVVLAAEDNSDTGFIHVDKGSVLTVKGNSVIEGQKTNRQHGVWVAGTLNLEQGVIRGFQSNLNGAGVYVTADGTANITGGEISGNKTTQNGGALYVEENATVTIAGGSYNNNQAFGGGVVFSNANITISGGTFNNNKASGSSAKGGVVYLEKNKLTISGGTFTNNSAPWGGVVYTKGTTEVTGGTFDANSATAVGGAALMSNKGNIKILGTAENKVKFQNNYVSADANNNSDGGGGVILLINEAALTLQNCEFSNNLHVGNAAGKGTDGCDIVFVRNPASGKKHELILMDKTFNGIVKITKAHTAGRFVIKTNDTDWNLGRTAEGLYTLNYDSKQLVPKAQ